jgi:hypothetical protein
MSILRNRNALQYFAQSLLICTALIYGALSAFGQTTASSREQAVEAQSLFNTSLASDQPSEDQQQPSTQPEICGVAHLGQCLKDIDLLRRGQLEVRQEKTEEQGKPIEVPDGLIHHWTGVMFVPGVSLERALALLQDYDNHWRTYKPDVRRSKLLEHTDNTFKI